MSNERVDPIIAQCLDSIFRPSRSEHGRLVDCAEAHQAVPDFADVNTLKEILPPKLVVAVADLMSVFQMGVHAHRDELLRSCAKLERAMFLLYSE